MRSQSHNRALSPILVSSTTLREADNLLCAPTEPTGNRHDEEYRQPFSPVYNNNIISSSSGSVIMRFDKPLETHWSSAIPRQQPVVLESSTTTSTMTKDVTTAVAAPTMRETTHSRRYILLVLFFFAGSSLGAVFVNKACLTHYGFSHPFMFMLGQAVSAVIAMASLARSRPDILTIVPVKRADYPRLLLPTGLFVANVSVGLSALTRINIPMFSAFRRLTVLFVMLAEYILLRRTHSQRVMASVFLLAFGAFVSGVGDVTFSRVGYTLVFLNNILTASYLAAIKRVMRDLNLDPMSLLYYTALLAILPVMVICHLTGDWHAALEAYASRQDLQASVFFVPSLLAVAASAFCVNLSTSICTHVTSPLTTSVVGQVKNVLQTVLGFFSWGYVPSPMNLFGLTVALVGQLLFGYFKFVEAHPDATMSKPSWMKTFSMRRRTPSNHELDSYRQEEEQGTLLGNVTSAGTKKKVGS